MSSEGEKCTPDITESQVELPSSDVVEYVKIYFSLAAESTNFEEADKTVQRALDLQKPQEQLVQK